MADLFLPDFALLSLKKAVLSSREGYERGGNRAEAYPKALFEFPSLMYCRLFSFSSHVLVWEIYATKER